MQTFFTTIGFLGCTVITTLAIFKVIEAVWFFQEFRKETTKALARIDEHLNNLKP
jgi:hypothetical protein